MSSENSCLTAQDFLSKFSVATTIQTNLVTGGYYLETSSPVNKICVVSAGKSGTKSLTLYKPKGNWDYYLIAIKDKPYHHSDDDTFILVNNKFFDKVGSSINACDIHEHGLDIVEELLPNSIQAVLQRSELVDVSSLIAA